MGRNGIFNNNMRLGVHMAQLADPDGSAINIWQVLAGLVARQGHRYKTLIGAALAAAHPLFPLTTHTGHNRGPGHSRVGWNCSRLSEAIPGYLSPGPYWAGVGRAHITHWRPDSDSTHKEKLVNHTQTVIRPFRYRPLRP